jgi:hypothetical protein
MESEMPVEELPEWMEFDSSLRPATPLRTDLSRPTSARVGERLDPDTGKYFAEVDEDGFEWILPARTGYPGSGGDHGPFSDAVGYNRETKQLRIVFHNVTRTNPSGQWEYHNVQTPEWYALRRAASTGRFMKRHIFSHPNNKTTFPSPW